MLRRLLAQFGLTALLMALGTGAVFADSATPASTPPVDPSQSVVSNATTVVVSTTHTATTTTGASVGGAGNSSGDGTPPSATPPATDADGGSTVNSSDGTATPTASSTNSPTNSTTPNLISGLSSATPGSAAAVPVSTTSQNSIVASFERAAYISGLSPVAPILATGITTGLGRPGRPSAPPVPVGFLMQLHVLLISILVPTVKFIPSAVRAAATSQAGLAVLLVMMLISLAFRALTVTATTYPARLRRSGFLGAARSDVASLLPFATPREMSSIGAIAPG